MKWRPKFQRRIQRSLRGIVCSIIAALTLSADARAASTTAFSLACSNLPVRSYVIGLREGRARFFRMLPPAFAGHNAVANGPAQFDDVSAGAFGSHCVRGVTPAVHDFCLSKTVNDTSPQPNDLQSSGSNFTFAVFLAALGRSLFGRHFSVGDISLFD